MLREQGSGVDKNPAPCQGSQGYRSGVRSGTARKGGGCAWWFQATPCGRGVALLLFRTDGGDFASRGSGHVLPASTLLREAAVSAEVPTSASNSANASSATRERWVMPSLSQAVRRPDGEIEFRQAHVQLALKFGVLGARRIEAAGLISIGASSSISGPGSCTG